jgi:hypothetical protein
MQDVCGDDMDCFRGCQLRSSSEVNCYLFHCSTSFFFAPFAAVQERWTTPSESTLEPAHTPSTPFQHHPRIQHIIVHCQEKENSVMSHVVERLDHPSSYKDNHARASTLPLLDLSIADMALSNRKAEKSVKPNSQIRPRFMWET